MAKVPYSKIALTYSQQLSQLKTRGLIVVDEEKAQHLLANVSYYRLSGYWYPLLSDKGRHLFAPNSTFDKAFQFYCFDKDLRKLVMNELEKIEVSIRAQIIYVMSHSRGPFWYQDVNLFSNTNWHRKMLENLEKEFKRSDADFIKAFRIKYSDPLPPSWMLLEISSFGTLSKLFENLNPILERRKIAHIFGLDDNTFASWLHCLVYLRNLCAHHSRLWDRTLSIQPRKPRNPHDNWLSQSVANNRTYFVLSMIIYFLNRVNPKHSFQTRLIQLFQTYPNVDLSVMGFPDDWQNEQIWNK